MKVISRMTTITQQKENPLIFIEETLPTSPATFSLSFCSNGDLREFFFREIV